VSLQHCTDLSVVIPARDEARSIRSVIAAARAQFPQAEIIVVDNGSTDGTGDIAVSTGEAIVVREDRPGKGNAMRAGASAASRDYILFHDADTEYSVADSVDVVRRILFASDGRRDATMAIGVRAWRLSWLPVISFGVNWLIRAIFQLRFGTAPEDILTGTRCMSREFFLALGTSSTTFAIETELTRLVVASGGDVVGLPVRYTPRDKKGGKKIGWRHLVPIVAQACATRIPPTEVRNGIAARYP
jgi:hypothetical protein